MCRILQFNFVKQGCEFRGLFFTANTKSWLYNSLPMGRQEAIGICGFGCGNALREITKRGRK